LRSTLGRSNWSHPSNSTFQNASLTEIAGANNIIEPRCFAQQVFGDMDFFLTFLTAAG